MLANLPISLTGWASFLAWTVVLGGLTVISRLNPWDPERRLALWGLRVGWGRLHWLTSPLWRVRREGVERVGAGPYVVVSNHQSVTDIPSIVGLPLVMRVVAGDHIFRAPIMGPFLTWMHMIRTDGLLADGADTLARGISVLVFAEGTRSTDGRLNRFRSGAFHLAAQTCTPILPVAVTGGRFILPKGKLLAATPFLTGVVRVLDPVDPAGFDSPDDLRRHVRDAIAAALEASGEA